jgi:post-GPI attachment to proteins factor 3
MRLVNAALIIILGLCRASEGDRSQAFRACVEKCSAEHCVAGEHRRASPLSWDCPSECKYSCMHDHDQKRRDNGQPAVKYFGKWPFKRVLGCQELLASLFSLANLAPQAYFLLRPPWPRKHYLRSSLIVYSLLGANAWVWAAVFHARDTRFTEAADYFSAMLALLYLIWIMLLRSYGGSRDVLWQHSQGRAATTVLLLAGTGLLGFFCQHVYNMMQKFDYGYHMNVGLVVAGVNMVGWLHYMYTIRDRPYTRAMLITFLLLNGSVALEVLDFPPLWQLLDAHATWHLATAPLSYMWYKYLRADVQFDMTVQCKKQ